MYNVQRTHIISGGAKVVKVPMFLLIIFTKSCWEFLTDRYLASILQKHFPYISVF
jgi:hypothetical protein